MRTITLFILLAVFAGCATQKRCLKKFPPVTTIERSDSIVIRDSIVYRDRIVHDTIEADTVFVDREIPVPEDFRSDPVEAENDYARARTWIENRKLKLELTQKEQVIERILKDAERDATHWRERYESEKTKEVVRERYVPPIFKWSLGILIGLVVLFFLWLFVRAKF